MNDVGSQTLSRIARLARAARTYAENVKADFELMREGRAKYLGDAIAEDALAGETLKRIGLQMMVAIRTMHFLRDAGFMTGARVTSRLIRHVYSAEIHPQSRWAPGVNIVHGNGLAVGSGAQIRHGCVLLHNVTLGDAFDKETGVIGGPTLDEHVHVGAGSTLLGPIHVGSHSKIMAGSTLAQSVPRGSLVRPAPVVITARDD